VNSIAKERLKDHYWMWKIFEF